MKAIATKGHLIIILILINPFGYGYVYSSRLFVRVGLSGFSRFGRIGTLKNEPDLK